MLIVISLSTKDVTIQLPRVNVPICWNLVMIRPNSRAWNATSVKPDFLESTSSRTVSGIIKTLSAPRL